MISFRQKGDFEKLDKYFKKAVKGIDTETLNKYGRAGVAALSSATPVDTGKTASSWGYKIERSSDSIVIAFTNSNVNQGVQIAVILQYGHGTGTGGWVQGIDYINPAIRPVFDNMVSDIWREVAGT